VNSDKRNDIQALRGFAVLIVVLHHHEAPLLRAGFLGVDIFFVISGFLITTLVARAIEAGRFSFGAFYLRRARRLLPAAYATLLLTAAGARLFLNDVELADLSAQMMGALTFSTNVVLLQQTDYFRSASAFKPLLHMWSLAVEEQFYFALPALLVAVSARRWRRMLAGLTLASMLLCAIGVGFKPVATFYLLPTRAWEMGIGALAALLLADPVTALRAQRWAARLFWPALAAVLLLPLMPQRWPHPGPAALLVCLATAVLIVRRHPLLAGGRAIAALVKVGDLSYPLYLVHWPLIAFANNAWVGGAGAHDRVGLRFATFALGFALAALLHRWVEQPLRERAPRLAPRTVPAAVTASAVLLALAVALPLGRATATDYAQLFRPNFGFAPVCEARTLFAPQAACASAAAPATLVWGDSFAMHLVPALVAAGGRGVIQATRSSCGPLLGVAPLLVAFDGVGLDYNARWAADCIDFNASVLRYLAGDRGVELVVLASPFYQYLDGARFRLLTRGAGDDRIGAADGEAALAALAALARTVAAVRALGKRVVLVAPPPYSDFNVIGCIERARERRIAIGAPPGCVIDEAAYRRSRAAVLAFLARVPAGAGTAVFRFDPLLCAAGSCATSLGAVPLYRDGGHLTVDGAAVLGRRFGLAARIDALAR
jgi:peptidoglycan/LPS O-acetylase OafA/YrhL